MSATGLWLIPSNWRMSTNPSEAARLSRFLPPNARSCATDSRRWPGSSFASRLSSYCTLIAIADRSVAGSIATPASLRSE